VFDILRFRFEGFNIDYKRYCHAMFQLGSTEQHGSRSSSAAAGLNLQGLNNIHCQGRLRLKRDDTRAEARFRLSPKRKSPFKSAGTLV